MMMCMMISGMHMMIESRVYTQLSSNEGLTTLCRLATQLWIDSALHVLNFCWVAPPEVW
jgi:hypothetical protein